MAKQKVAAITCVCIEKVKYIKRNSYVPLLVFPEFSKYRIYVLKGSICLFSHLKMEVKTAKIQYKKRGEKIIRENYKAKNITFAPVRTIFPETNISKTILGCFIR